MIEVPEESIAYRERGRPGLAQADVDRAADSLLREGVRPSVEKIRSRVGGSPNTIGPLLDKWWERLASRIEAGPDALARLPESLALAAEALFIRALDAARERAQQEHTRSTEALAYDRQLLETRRHTLTLRENELEERLAERNKVLRVLEHTLQYERGERRKLQATVDHLQKRLQELEARSTRARPRARPMPARKAPRRSLRVQKRTRRRKASRS